MTSPPLLPWPLPGRTDLRDGLVAAYSSGRGYHDLRHLAEVLARIDELGEAGNREVVLAAWYHDAVYDARGDNEERSARLAASSLAGIGVDVAEVARLVRLTTTHRPAPDDHSGAVLCDADLAILAAAPDRYEEYVAGVRREYAAVPDDDFRRGRLAVLRDLADRPALFHTAYARQTWEPAARANLAREIAALGG
jgi:predicted metal-dependent HD superfamily phosphohydrolase